MITGVRQSGAFSAPERVDFLTLPAYSKDAGGSYQSRSLDIDATALSRLRGEAIKAAIAGFQPDLFVVDNVPRGAMGEVVPTLELLARSDSTKCVLGLRDIIDDPATVRRQWIESGSFEATRNFYDAVWIYGDASVYDAVNEYGFPAEIRVKTRYTGYLNPADPSITGDETQANKPVREREDFVLCIAGGGQDGSKLLSMFATAELPPATRGLMVTGPFMPESDRQSIKNAIVANPNIVMRDFVSDPLPLISRATKVVAMGGYNTVMELVSLQKQALVIPRCRPRLEQLIRAQRFSSLGIIDFIREEDLTSEGIGDWFRSPSRPACAPKLVDFDGLERVTNFAADLIGCSMQSNPANLPAREAHRDAI